MWYFEAEFARTVDNVKAIVKYLSALLVSKSEELTFHSAPALKLRPPNFDGGKIGREFAV